MICICLPGSYDLLSDVCISPQALTYSDKIRHMLPQNITSMQEGGVKMVKLKQGTTALVLRTLNPDVDDNSAIMVVKEVCKSVTLGNVTVRENTTEPS